LLGSTLNLTRRQSIISHISSDFLLVTFWSQSITTEPLISEKEKQ